MTSTPELYVAYRMVKLGILDLAGNVPTTMAQKHASIARILSRAEEGQMTYSGL